MRRPPSNACRLLDDLRICRIVRVSGTLGWPEASCAYNGRSCAFVIVTNIHMIATGCHRFLIIQFVVMLATLLNRVHIKCTGRQQIHTKHTSLWPFIWLKRSYCSIEFNWNPINFYVRCNYRMDNYCWLFGIIFDVHLKVFWRSPCTYMRLYIYLMCMCTSVRCLVVIRRHNSIHSTLNIPNEE